MSRTRAASVVVLSLRVAYGVGLIAAPGRLASRWLGDSALRAPTQVPLRGLGAREIVLHCGALAAAATGASLRPWLAASLAGDLTDIAATVAGRDQLPDGAAVATALVAGGSGLISAVLAVADDEG